MSYLQQLRDTNLLRPSRDHEQPDAWHDKAAPAFKPGQLLCMVLDCFEPAESNGLCEKHNLEWEEDEP